MRITDTKNLFAVTLISFGLTAAAFAQQPFESAPEPNAAPASGAGQPQDPGLPSETPIQIQPNIDRTPVDPGDLPQDLVPGSDQAEMVNDKFAGWQGVSLETGQLNDQGIRRNWIMTDANGRFDGMVNTVGDADVDGMIVFLMNAGRLVQQTTVKPDATFRFNNVRPGAYALIGWGNNGFFAFGFNIAAYNDQAVGELPPNLITATAYQNKTTINTDWIRYYAPTVGFRVYGGYAVGEGRDDPQALYGFRGIFSHPPVATPASSLSGQAVMKTADGRVVGRVHQFNTIHGRPVDVRSTKVMLLENDSVVASTTTDNFGIFDFEDVPNGSYAVLAVGTDGVGLIGVNVVDAGDPATDAGADSIDFTMISAETIGWLNYYASEVAYQRGLFRERKVVPEAPLYDGFGCQQCNMRAYLESNCRSRGITFEQWQAACQNVRSGFGEGRFMEQAGKDLRAYLNKVDNAYDRAFYPNEYDSYGDHYGSNYGQPGGTNDIYSQPGYSNGYGQPGYYGGYGQPVPQSGVVPTPVPQPDPSSFGPAPIQ